MFLRPNLLNTAIIVAIICAMTWAQDDDARATAVTPNTHAIVDQEEADALNSREWVGQQVCGPNKTAVWSDDKTLTCLRDIGQSLDVAAGARP